MAVSHTVLSAVFSDESPDYRFPSEPDSGDTVRIRLRVARDSAERVILDCRNHDVQDQIR